MQVSERPGGDWKDLEILKWVRFSEFVFWLSCQFIASFITFQQEKDRQAREEERKRKIKGEGRGSVWSATFGPGSPISETGSIISRKIRKLSNAIMVKLSPSHAPNGGTVADGLKSDDLNQEELDEICAIDDIKGETEVMLENKSKGTSQEETTI